MGAPRFSRIFRFIKIMKPKDNLFALIHSMTTAEKRAFIGFARQTTNGKASNYLKLFHATEQQNEYDEAAIKKKFHGEKFINQLTATKHYLYHLILRSLRQHDEDMSAEDDICQLHRNALILLNRELPDQAYQMAVKARDIALRYEYFEYLPAAYNIEARSLAQIGDSELEHARGITDESMKALDLLNNVIRHRQTLWKVSVMHQELSRNKFDESAQAFRQMLAQGLLAQDSTATSLHARADQHSARAYCYMSLREFEQAHAQQSQAIGIYRDNPHFIREYPAEFAFLLCNQVSLLLLLKQYDGAWQLLAEIKALPIRNRYQREQFLFLSLLRECDLYLRQGGVGLEKVFELERNILQFFKEHLPPPEQQFYLSSHIALCFFMAEEYGKTLEWFSLILNKPEMPLRPDVYRNLRLGLAVAHFERGNYDAMESAVTSAYRYMRKRGQFLQMEQLAIKFLRRLASTGPSHDTPQLFTEAYRSLIAIPRSPSLETYIAYPIISWFGARSQGLPVRQFYTSTV